MLILLILAVIAVAVFAHMTFYVAGAILGILLVIVAAIVRRRRRQ